MNRREQNIRVFFDTESWCRSTEKLRRTIRRSKAAARVIAADEQLTLPPCKESRTLVEVTAERTFQAVFRLHAQMPDKKIGVLNFASATNPGGGVRSGSSAQEESLCRLSTLYPVLTDSALYEGFYALHRSQADRRYTDTCIYTPGIVICKSDEMVPQRLEEKDWVTVDVITCAAPCLRPLPPDRAEGKACLTDLPDEALFAIHHSRARKILSVAAFEGIEVFVTGAFGCGAFMNDPMIVSEAWKQALSELDGCLDQVVFAVFTGKRDTTNLDVFRSVFI